MKKRKKLFVSQVMNGKSKEEIMKLRERVKNFADENGYVIADSYITENCPSDLQEDNRGVWYLGKSLEILAGCDAILMTPGSENARGCKIERQVAESYGIKIYDWKDFS